MLASLDELVARTRLPISVKYWGGDLIKYRIADDGHGFCYPETPEAATREYVKLRQRLECGEDNYE